MKKSNRFVCILVIAIWVICLGCQAFASSVESDDTTVCRINHVVYRNDKAYDGTYIGPTVNDLPEGMGLFISSVPVESTMWHYWGEWKDGAPNGEGTVYYDNGDMEKGIFADGQLVDGLIMLSAGLEIKRVQAETGELPETREVKYIGNRKSLAFHYPECTGVQNMKDANKVELYSLEDALSQGYHACGTCKPN